MCVCVCVCVCVCISDSEFASLIHQHVLIYLKNNVNVDFVCISLRNSKIDLKNLCGSISIIFTEKNGGLKILFETIL